MQPSVRTILLGAAPIRPVFSAIVGDSFDSRVTFTRASAATYVDSTGIVQTASSGSPRFGYDPVTHAALGYLSEEARTNLVIQSGNPSSVNWSGFAATKTNPAVADPFGGTAVGLYTADGSNAQHGVAAATTTVVSGTKYATSGFFKAGTANRIQLAFYGIGFPQTDYINFSLVGSGSILATGGLAVGSIQAYPGGWYRLTATTASDQNQGNVNGMVAFFINSDTATRAPTYTSTETIYSTGAQMEAVSTNSPGPTSYIPTTTATVTRAADVASILTSAFPYNQAAGTFVETNTPLGDYNLKAFAMVAWQDDNDTLGIIRRDATGATLGKRWEGSAFKSPALAAIITGANDTGGTTKSALAYAANDIAFSNAGSLIGTDATVGLITPTVLYIGSYTGTQQWLNGHIGKLDYYNTRLFNDKLQSLTV